MGKPLESLVDLEKKIHNIYEQRRSYRTAIIQVNARITAIKGYLLTEQDPCRIEKWKELLEINKNIAAELNKDAEGSDETLSLFTGIWKRLVGHTPDNDILNPLCIGQSFQLTEETNLIPELYSALPIDVFHKVKKLPMGTRIEILDAKVIRFIIYYHVKTPLEKGWISSLDLIGQGVNPTHEKEL